MLSGIFAVQLLLGDDVLEIEVGSDGVSGGHEVVVVHSLHEGLHLGASLDLLLAHGASHSQSVSLNAGNQGVSELLVLMKKRDQTSGWSDLPSFHRRVVSQ